MIVDNCRLSVLSDIAEVESTRLAKNALIKKGYLLKSSGALQGWLLHILVIFLR